MPIVLVSNVGGSVAPAVPGGWSPVTLTNSSGGAIVPGNICYLIGNDAVGLCISNGTLAQASCVCMALDNIANGGTGRFVFGGRVTGVAGGAFGALGYVGTTAGVLATVPDVTAGHYNTLVGLWTSATSFEFNPQLPIAN